MKKKLITWIAAIAMLAGTVLPEVPVYASQPEEIIMQETGEADSFEHLEASNEDVTDPDKENPVLDSENDAALTGNEENELLNGAAEESENDAEEVEVAAEEVEETAEEDDDRLLAVEDLFEVHDMDGNAIYFSDNPSNSATNVLCYTYLYGSVPEMPTVSVKVKNKTDGPIFLTDLIAVVKTMNGGSTNDTLPTMEIGSGEEKTLAFQLRSGRRVFSNGFYSGRNVIRLYYETDSDQTGSIDIPFDLSVGLGGDYSCEELSTEELENADTWYLIGDTNIILDAGEKIENSDRLICNGSGIDAALTISGSGSMTFGSVEVEEVEIAGGIVRGEIANARKNNTINITGGEYRLDNGLPDDSRVKGCTVNINGGVLRSNGAIRSRFTKINVTDGALYAKAEDGEDAVFVEELTFGSGIVISEPEGGEKKNEWFDDNVAHGKGYHIVFNGHGASEVFIRKPYSSDAIILDISPDELITFAGLKKYVMPTEIKEVTITNQSPFPVRFVSASADDFEITDAVLPIITARGSHTFHVKAKPDLEVGEHTGWMTFVTSDGDEKKVQLKITITANNAKAEFTDHAVEGNTENAIVEFDDLGTGYDANMIESETVTVKNTGLESLTFRDVTSTAFSVSLPDERILPVGESMQLEVAPKLNLAVGTHDENIKISTEQGFTLSLLAQFEVRAASPAAAYLTAEDGEPLGQSAAYPLPFPIRYTTDGKDDSWQPSFWIKNTGNVRFKVQNIVDYTATKNTFAWDKDTFVYPGQAVKVVATINHAEKERLSGADITFLYAGGTTGTSKVYFSEKA
ncbi:MAG: hypothetical protein K6D90_06895, partial [Lachnospiraceae bacterium]|nr:hypothetical protein [Lachnospiraceae bacterium]